MSLSARLSALAQAIAADIKALTSAQGSLAALNTNAKGNLVAAINELQAVLASAITDSEILDTAGAGDTGHTWSADKIVAQLAELKSQILNGAPAAYDTLIEISDKLAGDDTAIAGLLSAVGDRATKAEVGDTDHNFVADYAAAKA